MRTFVLVIASMLATFSFGVFLFKGLVPLYQTKQEVEAKAKEVQYLMKENAELAEKIGRLKHDMDYVERLIREDYGLIGVGDVIYRFEPEDSPANK